MSVAGRLAPVSEYDPQRHLAATRIGAIRRTLSGVACTQAGDRGKRTDPHSIRLPRRRGRK